MAKKSSSSAESSGGRNSPGGADFVAQIVKDPANPPQTTLLSGYVGASSEAGHTRLYFDPGLTNYVEIPDDAILHHQDVDEPGGLGGTHLWVRRDAELISGPAGAQRQKGRFLEGPIMQANVGAAAAQPLAPRPISPAPLCPVNSVFNCPSPFFCPSQAPLFCITFHFPQCPTFQPHCSWFCPIPTTTPGVCPSVGICPPPSIPECPAGGGPGPFAAQAAVGAAGVSAACQASVHICPTPSAIQHCPSAPCPITLPLCPTEACPPSLAIACPQSVHICPTPSAVHQCPTLPQVCGIATQINCPTHAPLLCPVTPHCPPTPIVPCQTHAPLLCPITPHCVSVLIPCVTQNLVQCPPPITINPAQCPVASGFICGPVSLGCPVQSIACGFPGGNPVAGG
jgi:hypothetical protein